jgi:hypothetical protein
MRISTSPNSAPDLSNLNACRVKDIFVSTLLNFIPNFRTAALSFDKSSFMLLFGQFALELYVRDQVRHH